MLRECVCSLSYPAYNAHAPYCHLWPPHLYNIFPHYLTNGIIFEEKKLLNIKCVFWFSPQLLSETLLILRNDRGVIKNVYWSSCEVLVIVVRLSWNLNFLDIFSKITQISNFMKIHPVGAELFHVDRRTDMAMPTVAFRNFANPPKKCHWNKFCFEFRFFSCQSQSTKASYSPSSTCCSYQKDEWAKPGNLPKSYAISESGSIG